MIGASPGASPAPGGGVFVFLSPPKVDTAMGVRGRIAQVGTPGHPTGPRVPPDFLPFVDKWSCRPELVGKALDCQPDSRRRGKLSLFLANSKVIFGRKCTQPARRGLQYMWLLTGEENQFFRPEFLSKLFIDVTEVTQTSSPSDRGIRWSS